MSRVPYVDVEQLSPGDRDLLTRPINLFRALAQSPAGLRRYQALGEWIRWDCELDPRLRELAILQVGLITRCDYEFSHHIRIGRDFGVTEDDLGALLAPEAHPDHFTPLESVVLAVARELTSTADLRDSTWEALSEHLPTPRIVDLIHVVAFYSCVIRVLAGLRVDVEVDYQGYLDTYPYPPTTEPVGLDTDARPGAGR